MELRDTDVCCLELLGDWPKKCGLAQPGRAPRLRREGLGMTAGAFSSLPPPLLEEDLGFQIPKASDEEGSNVMFILFFLLL